ncbi:MAG: cache domain-containing protein [Peptostreptococcaceae bacterium]|nr:cache domain-containing protein [Peptostreptococcaceae bacterium]
MKYKISLKTGINLFVIAFSIISVALSGLVVRNMASEKIVSTSIQKNGYIARAIAENLDIYLSNAMETVETAAAFSSDSDGDFLSIQNEIFRIYDNFSYFDLIFFMDKEGKILFSKPTNTEVTDISTYIHRDYYHAVKDSKKSAVSELFMSTILDRPHFVLASPVFSDGEWIGLIGCGIPIENIEEIIQKSRHDLDGKVWVIDTSGNVVIDPFREDLTSIEKLEQPILEDRSGEKVDHRTLIEERRDFDGRREYNGEVYTSSIRMLDRFGWMIMVEQTERSMRLEAVLFDQRIFNALLLVLASAILFAIFFSSSITDPIRRLVEDTENVGSDNYHVAQYQNTFLEVEELADAFIRMGDRIDRKIKDVESANLEIRMLRQRLMDIFENLTLGVIVCDNEGQIDFINRRIVTLTGYSEEEILGKTIDGFYDRLGIDPNSIRLDPSPYSDSLNQVEIEIQAKDGQIVPVMIASDPLTTAEGERDGRLITINDLSELKFLEEEVMREDRIRLLGELSASIIHDIGNPLAGISNLVEVVQSTDLSEEEQEEALSIIHTEVADLNKMVRDFLDYTKSKGIEKETIDLGEFIKEIIALFRLEAKKREISIETSIDEEEIFLTLNRMEVKQALINILKNSIYAVDDGGVIRISVSRDNGKVDIMISDDGEGIKEENLKRIFDPFFTTKRSGTGLGLPIAYKSIRSNGGYISVGSTEGRGTDFIITFLE